MTKSETHKYVNSLRSENEKLKAQQKSIKNKLTELEESAKEPVCEWKLLDADNNAYQTECGDAFCIPDGTPQENNMNYCSCCGRKVKVVE